LDTAGFKNLKDTEVEALADHFTEIGANVQPPKNVNYRKLIAAVDKVFSDEEAATKFKSGAMSMSDGFASMAQSQSDDMFRKSLTTFAPNQVEDEERMDHIMHRLAALCLSKGFVFKFLFQDFERSLSASPARTNPIRSGKCTVNQFKRKFPFQKEFSEEEIDLLVERYKTKGGDVYFQAIHEDISEVPTAEAPPFPQSPLHLKPDATQWDHQTLNPVKKLQCKVVEKRIRLSDAFKDFDPLRKGFCSVGHFKCALVMLGLDREIDRNDFAQILELYSDPVSLMFCYALFIRDIDAAFSVPGLEKEPLATTPLPDASTTAPGRRNRMRITKEQRAKINALEDRIRSRIVKERILMKPFFLDMDKANKGLVTRNQFLRIMGSQLFFKDFGVEEVNLLALVYCDRGNHNDFNYIDFIKACDPPFEEEVIAMSQLNAPYQDQCASKYFLPGGKVKQLDRTASQTSFGNL
jgi:hypothetical protein